MTRSSPARVLDVGQCNPDHGAISAVLTCRFAVEVDRAASVAEAVEAMRQTRYGLVLVNRLLDADGSDGLELLRESKVDPQLADVPIMLVSNYAEAQDRAVEAGAERGFGKAELHDPGVVARLAEFLPEAE